MARKQYQGGSILTFVIIAVAIAALLIGGVVWLRQRGDAARQQNTTQDVAREIPAKQEESNTNKEAKKETGSNTATQSAIANEDKQSADTSAQPTHLPETGPAELLLSILGLSAMTYIAARYTVSRNELARALS